MSNNKCQPAVERTTCHRRQFVKTTVCGAAAAACGLVSGRAPAADAVKRNGKPHMKLSLAGYSFSRFLPRNWTPEQLAGAKMNLDQFIHYCAELDLDGTELTGYYFPRDITHAYLMHLKQLTFQLGLDISGTAIGNDFCLAPGEARDAQLKMTRDWIDHAAVMGAPVIRIFAGRVPKGDSEAVAIERCVEGINESLRYAAERGVFLALENHGGITATPDQMLRIIKAVDASPWFGVNFDGGNFRTDDPYRDMARIAPYAINAQLKVAVSVNGRKQPADMERIVEILKDADYRGYVVLEYEEKDDPWKGIPPHIAKLRDLIRR